MKLKAIAVAVALSASFSAHAFTYGGDYQPADIASQADIASMLTDVATGATVTSINGSSAAFYTQNTALISQDSTGNSLGSYALIDQTGGDGNLAIIVQAAAGAAAAVGVVYQNGSNNVALIKQH